MDRRRLTPGADYLAGAFWGLRDWVGWAGALALLREQGRESGIRSPESLDSGGVRRAERALMRV